MKLKKGKIIDERQEMQSLKNSSTVNTVMLIMLCLMMVVQTFFLQRGFAYYGPEFIVLMTGSILKIGLDIKHGLVYTEMNSKTKLTIFLYVISALIFAVLYGIRNYILFDFEAWMIVLVIIPMFFEMLILFGLAHYIYLKLSKRRLQKLEKKLDRDEFEE